MLIETVDTINFCQHTGQFQFGAGLNAIQGPNGSGKTNIINAAIFALTGNLARLHGVKADNICWSAGKKDRSEVEIRFKHKEAQVTIKRGLRPAYQEMKIQGVKEPITADKEISYKLEELLGINERMLLDYVFVPQWGIFNFIDQQPSVRARAFAELFGVEEAERIYHAMGQHKIDVPAPAVAADIVRARVNDHKVKLDETATKLAAYTDVPTEWDDCYDRVVAQWKQKEQLADQIAREDQNLAAHEQRIEAMRFEVDPFADQVKALEEAVEESQTDFRQAQEGLQAWKLYEQAERGHLLAFERMRAAKKRRDDKLACPPKAFDSPLPDFTLKDLKEELPKRQARLQQLQAIITNFDNLSDDIRECPTCGTPVHKITENQNSFRQEEAGLRPTVEQMTATIAGLERQNWDKHYYDQELARFESELKSCEEQLGANPKLEKPTSSRDQYQRLIQAFNDAQTDLRGKQDTLRIGQAKIQRMEADRDALRNLRDQHQREHYAIPVTEWEAEQARLQGDQMRTRMLERDQLCQQQQLLQRLITDDEAALEQCRSDQKRASHLRDLATHLDEVREVYRDLPKLVSQHHLEEMRMEINGLLTMFNARFRVEAIHDLRFILRYSSGKTQPAERLSGGERVMFALALRIVVNSRFAEELGLLCLDEPTSGLDEDNVQCLEIALGRLRDVSQTRGLQVILITHNKGLDGLVDRVIRLQAAS